MSNRRALLLVLLAVVCTGLNAFKPLHIDDAAYAYYSRQDATHPLDPYGFNILWYCEPQPALEVLAPPVLPYTWAAARALFGERPWAWKWAMLPWSLLLVGSVYALLRRFAAGVELPLTVMTVLSPAILPSINLMLDVPALALSLASVYLFLVACDRDSFGRAAAAGLVAGLAMQTKYTGVVAPAVMLLAAATTGRWRLWPAAAVAAAQVFLSWELLMALLYGQSHFLLSLRANAGSFLDKGALAALFFSYLGGLAPFLVVLGMAALGVRRRWLAAAVVLILAGFALIVLFEGHFSGEVRPSPRLFGPIQTPEWSFPLSEVVFDAFAGGGVVVLVFVARRLWSGDDRRGTLFLLLWLGLEALAYYPLTPFPAARRVLGALVPLTLLIGRLAARAWRTPRQRRAAWLWAGGAAILGLAFFALDAWEAHAEVWGAEQAAAWIAARKREAPPVLAAGTAGLLGSPLGPGPLLAASSALVPGSDGGGRALFVGHHGFQYYADRCGMRSTYQYALPPDAPREGDWLAAPDGHVASEEIDLTGPALREEARLTLTDPVPLRTVLCYYGGRAPLEHHEGPRMTVRIFRVIADFQPRPERPPPAGD